MQINKRNKIPRRPHAERRAATRRALLDAGRKLFAKDGYGSVTIESLVREAGVTRGALYHYFEDKGDLFRAVAEEVNTEIDATIEETAKAEYTSSGDALEAAIAGTYAYLDACSRPAVRQLILTDGPVVLGWEAWHEMDASHALEQIEAGLEMLMDHEIMEPQSKGLLSHLIHGALIEAAIYIASSGNPQEARQEAGYGLRSLMEGLCKRGSPPPIGESED